MQDEYDNLRRKVAFHPFTELIEAHILELAHVQFDKQGALPKLSVVG